MLTYEFIRIAFIVGIFLGIGCSLLSPFLVLSNNSLIADGLSHASFTGIIIGLLFSNQPIWIAMIYTIIASIVITLVSKKLGSGADTAIGLVGAISMAVGLIIVSLSDGFNQSIEALLVGNIFTSTYLEMALIIIITVVIALVVFLLYPKLLSNVFDKDYARHQGVPVDLLDYMLSILTALLVVVGVRTAGILLISALIIFPSAISRNFSYSFKQNILIGFGISILSIIIGIISAHYLSIPAASTIVCVYALVLVSSYIYKAVKRK